MFKFYFSYPLIVSDPNTGIRGFFFSHRSRFPSKNLNYLETFDLLAFDLLAFEIEFDPEM